MDSAYFILAAALIVAAAMVAFALRRPAAPVLEPPKPDPRLDTLIAKQGEIEGQFKSTLTAQAELQRTLLERMDALNKRMGDSLSESATKTAETVAGIGERLSIIDAAQKNIASLSTQVVALQDILSDKQQRGAFGQERMEAIIADQLAPSLYEFQHTLSNGSRPDCIIRVPNVQAVVVVDSKFPLEAFEAMRGTGEDERKPLSARLRADVLKHVGDIASKYLIPGETQSPALMFVPSESIYAELHANFADLVQKARQQNVVIVSPHILMLAVNTIQALTRDAKMREQAHQIQNEVVLLLKDVNLLAERVEALRTHFERTSKDIGEIEKPMGRITSRAARIEQADLALPEPAPSMSKPS
jgi:DNA recombination protein RmuC